MQRSDISLPNILAELEGLYETGFLKELVSIPNVRVFLFGGAIRDMLLGRPWKEADIRVVLDGDWSTREGLVEGALSGLELDKERIEPANLTIYRFLPAGSSTSHAIDLSLVPTLDDNTPDFTINSIFVDLDSGEIIDKYDGVSDLNSKLLRTVRSPEEQFRDEPHIMFRAIKCACQFGLTIDEGTAAAMSKHADKVSQTFEFIEKEKKGILVELFLANIFRGLNYNSHRYFDTVQSSGILMNMVNYFASKLSSSGEDFDVSSDNIFSVRDESSFEEKVSVFLSFIADHVSRNGAADAFGEIRSLLSMDRPMEYMDFEVDTSQINYVSQ